jgi:hypothetical protein
VITGKAVRYAQHIDADAVPIGDGGQGIALGDDTAPHGIGQGDLDARRELQ